MDEVDQETSCSRFYFTHHIENRGERAERSCKTVFRGHGERLFSDEDGLPLPYGTEPHFCCSTDRFVFTHNAQSVSTSSQRTQTQEGAREAVK
jgi:hypothetical protein